MKKSSHVVPKVVIDLPFEGRKVEGSRKYRSITDSDTMEDILLSLAPS